MLEKKCDINIDRTIDLAREMIRLAQTGYEQREDPDCGILYGILLDSGYRLLDLAQKEKQSHKQKRLLECRVKKGKHLMKTYGSSIS
ncbi:hypothetical protein [Desulfobacula phenolica]|uniref:Uncharacterized protein n=1 Tax=Desulfobacula phenolica TaxID=90732 RepID=A0A1H2JF86_9BACT|nr:hypothetical protein [Desulfobacula phenolica]SDU55069.1 hypothetical protein SAMN04487931_11228 [Desulfobacula phenolica]